MLCARARLIFRARAAGSKAVRTLPFQVVPTSQSGDGSATTRGGAWRWHCTVRCDVKQNNARHAMRCYAKPHVNATPCIGPRPSDIDETGDEQMRQAIMLSSQCAPLEKECRKHSRGVGSHERARDSCFPHAVSMETYDVYCI